MALPDASSEVAMIKFLVVTAEMVAVWAVRFSRLDSKASILLARTGNPAIIYSKNLLGSAWA